MLSNKTSPKKLGATVGLPIGNLIATKKINIINSHAGATRIGSSIKLTSPVIGHMPGAIFQK